MHSFDSYLATVASEEKFGDVLIGDGLHVLVVVPEGVGDGIVDLGLILFEKVDQSPLDLGDFEAGVSIKIVSTQQIHCVLDDSLPQFEVG